MGSLGTLDDGRGTRAAAADEDLGPGRSARNLEEDGLGNGVHAGEHSGWLPRRPWLCDTGISPDRLRSHRGFVRANSSVGQSTSFTPRGSGVRAPLCPLHTCSPFRDPRGKTSFLRGSRRFCSGRATGCNSPRMPAAPAFAPLVRRCMRRFREPSPARRSIGGTGRVCSQGSGRRRDPGRQEETDPRLPAR